MKSIVQIVPEKRESLSISKLSVYSDSDFIIRPFAPIIFDFSERLSRKIIKDNSLAVLPEMIALGFWLRRANLIEMKRRLFVSYEGDNIKVAPLGIVMHICPANVDTMFLYSLMISLLLGNKNIARISSRMESAAINKLFDHINEVLNEDQFVGLKDYVNIISYEHDNFISEYISKRASARVIWGGDQTVNTFKAILSSPRTKDIVFADRVSVMVMNYDGFIDLSEKETSVFLKNFFNDAFTFDQMGCSSPQIIYFIGVKESFDEFFEKFISLITSFVVNNYGQDYFSLASLKYSKLVNDLMNNIVINHKGNTPAKFVELVSINENSLHGCGGGYFYYKRIESIENLKVLQNSRIQTVSYYGLDSLQINDLSELAQSGVGIDRIVPLGNALSFYPIWDGYNLFEELSRKVYVG